MTTDDNFGRNYLILTHKNPQFYCCIVPRLSFVCKLRPKQTF
jgi:hypothetical protein